MNVFSAVLAGLQILFTAGTLVSFIQAAKAMRERSTLRWQVTGAVFVVGIVTAPLLRVVFTTDTPWPLAVFTWAVFVAVVSAMSWYIIRRVRTLRTSREDS